MNPLLLEFYKSSRNLFVVMLLLVLLQYGTVLLNGYSLDDEFIYTSNKIATNGLSNVSNIFSETSFDYGEVKFGYRPITILSFAIENEFFGINPFVSHLINLLLYIFLSLTFYKVLKLLFPKEEIQYILLTVLLFLLLPIHSELVNNVKCRDELLALTFGLLSLYFWLKASDKKYFYVIAIVSLLLSILSKKTGFIFLGIVPLGVFFKTDGSWKKGLLTLLIMITPLVLFKLIIKFLKEEKSIRNYDFIENPLFGGELDYSRIAIVLETNWFYLKSLIFPTEFVSYYGYKTLRIVGYSFQGVIGLVIVLSLIVLSIKVFKQRKAYLFGLCILLIGLFPFLNIITPMVGIVAERFITIASFGSCIFIVFGVRELLQKVSYSQYYKYFIGLVVIYIVGYFPAIKARNTEWNSKFSVMEADLKKYPKNVILNSNLASNYSSLFSSNINNKQKQFYGKRIVELTQNANSVYPSAENYFILGSTLYLAQKDVKKAEKNLKIALEMDSIHFGATKNLAAMYKELKQTDNSIYYFQRLLRIYPENLAAYPELAQQLVEQGKFDMAMEVVNKGIKLNGEKYELVLTKGNIFYFQRNAEKTIFWYQKVLAIRPNNGTIKQRYEALLQARANNQQVVK